MHIWSRRKPANLLLLSMVLVLSVSLLPGHTALGQDVLPTADPAGLASPTPGGGPTPDPDTPPQPGSTEDPAMGATPSPQPVDDPDSSPEPMQPTATPEASPTYFSETPPIPTVTLTPAITPGGVPSPLTALVVSEGAEVIPNHYIVIMKPEYQVAENEAAIRESIAGMGGQVLEVFAAVLNGLSAYLPPEALAWVLADPQVDYVEADQLIKAPVDTIMADSLDTQAAQSGPVWGLDRVDQRDLPLDGAYVYDGLAENVHVYVIDSGIRDTHNEFGGRATRDFDSVGDGNNGRDCHGHGSHVAGIIGGATFGVAKGVRLHAVRISDCGFDSSISRMAAGINWVAANHVKPAVANISHGGFSPNATIDKAINGLVASGVTVVVAAGNKTSDACSFSPMRVPAAVTVGASTIKDARASFSNFGSCVDIFAPGEGIRSAWWDSNNSTYILKGTSMAAPHVAGAAALYLQLNPLASPEQVWAHLAQTATQNRIGNPGTNSPNKLLYVRTIPEVLNPSGYSTSPSPAFTWTTVAGASHYHYEVSDGQNLIHESVLESSACSPETCSHQPGLNLGIGTHHWRVRTYTGDQWSIYSAYRAFEISGPAALLSPLGVTYTRLPAYRWRSVAGATQYQYQVFLGEGLLFSKTVSSSVCSGGQCVNRPSNTLAYGESYQWRVRANIGGSWQPYQEFSAFKVVKPLAQTVAPAANIFTTSPEYRWTEVEGAERYQVQVYQGTRLIFRVETESDTCDGSLCRISPDVPLGYGSYKWRVRAYAGGIWNGWSAYRNFKVINPVPRTLAPIGTVYLTSPLFKWSRVSGAVQYQFRVFQDGIEVYTLGVNNTVCGSSSCQVRLPQILPDGAYQWQVQSYAGGTWHDWSIPRAFTVVNPVPQAIDPAGVTHDPKPTYTWSRVSGASQYQYQLYRGTSLVYSKQAGSAVCLEDLCQQTPTGTLAQNEYRWRVRAYLGGSWKAWSAFRAFSVSTAQ